MLWLIQLITFVFAIISIGMLVSSAMFFVNEKLKQSLITFLLCLIALIPTVYFFSKIAPKIEEKNQNKVTATCKAFGGVDLESKQEGTEAIMFLCNEGPRKIRLVEK